MPIELDLSQYTGVWAIEDSRFGQMLSHIRSLNLAAHVAAVGIRNVSDISVEMSDNVAIVDINGTMTKRGSSLSDAGSTVKLRQAIRQLASNDSVGGIILRMDTPGGSVGGVDDLAREVAAAKKKKPVYAFIEDLTASAGYWIASQATAIYASNRTAEIGSIGVYMVVYDVSKLADKEGVEAVVIRTSPLKGAGVEGEPISDDAKAYWQELVNGFQKEFKAVVQSGRKMTDRQLEAVATGRVWMAEEAQSLKLIDGIQTFDETLLQIKAAAAERSNKGRTPKGKTMSEEVKAASYVEIVEACGGLDPLKQAEDAMFVCKQMDAETPADKVAKNWMAELKARSEASKQAAEEATKKTTAERKIDGAAPLEDTKSKDACDDADPVADWNAAVDEQVKAGLSRQKAIAAVDKKFPGMRQAMVDFVNKK